MFLLRFLFYFPWFYPFYGKIALGGESISSENTVKCGIYLRQRCYTENTGHAQNQLPASYVEAVEGSFRAMMHSWKEKHLYDLQGLPCFFWPLSPDISNDYKLFFTVFPVVHKPNNCDTPLPPKCAKNERQYWGVAVLGCGHVLGCGLA